MPFQPASPSPRTAPRSDLSDDALTEVLRSVVHDVSKLHGIPRSDVQCRIQLIPGLDDTEFALGSDALQAANQGYALLKVVGKAQGLDGVRKDLSARFVRRRRQPERWPPRGALRPGNRGPLSVAGKVTGQVTRSR